ncbi:acetylgalactosaminyl-O-glycosyl-glycoprotein beta-1,3-N-acetylglucosaminyltransferase-like [Haemaphysalis longicornis]
MILLIAIVIAAVLSTVLWSLVVYKLWKLQASPPTPDSLPEAHGNGSVNGSVDAGQVSPELQTAAQHGGWVVSQRCRHPLYALVCVHTRPPAWQLRAALRDTLFEEAAAVRFNWTVVFFVDRRDGGQGEDPWLNVEADTTGDVVVLPFEDGHRNLTTKWVAAMQWVETHCPGVERIVRIDDDVFAEPFKLAQYLRVQLRQRPSHLHCHVTRITEVQQREAPGRLSVAPADLRGDGFFPSCFGRAIMMTLVVMRDLLRAATVAPVQPQDDAYVTGDLAMDRGIGHVAIDDLCEWNARKTNCIFTGRCIFAHALSPYDLTTGRRAKWALLLWRYRLHKGDTLDLSKRLKVDDYRIQIQRNKLMGVVR